VAAGLLRRQLGSSAALMLFTTPSPEASALVPVGRALLGAWLRLNEAGFGVQPHSLPSLFVYEELCGDLPSDFDHELMRQGSVTLSRAFGLGPAERPVLLLRAGLAAPFPERARTPRRPLGEVLRSAEATEP
jgi:hypothetical protein